MTDAEWERWNHIIQGMEEGTSPLTDRDVREALLTGCIPVECCSKQKIKSHMAKGRRG
jgi:hypothetical protein